MKTGDSRALLFTAPVVFVVTTVVIVVMAYLMDPARAEDLNASPKMSTLEMQIFFLFLCSFTMALFQWGVETCRHKKRPWLRNHRQV